ncbi:MAG: prepilin-type N-terminal cleavage/methylation domain-containing protein [Armatimonadota bacterium]
MKFLSNSKQKQSGFSLVELNVAIVLFLLSAVAIIGILTFCTAGAKKSTELAQCVQLAQRKMAETICLGADDIKDAAVPAAFPSPFERYAYTVRKIKPTDTRLSDFVEVCVTVKSPTGTKTELVTLKNSKEAPSTWAKLFSKKNARNADVKKIIQTKDGGYLVIISFNYPGKSSRPWILKLNPDGSVAWEKEYDVGRGFHNLTSVCENEDGSFTAIGTSDKFGGDRECGWIIKLNPDGSTAWEKLYGTRGATTANYLNTIQRTSDGGYIASGDICYDYYSSYKKTRGWQDGWVVKFRSDGSIQWQKAYGGSETDMIHSARQTSDGGYIMTIYDSSSGAAWTSRLCVMKLNSDGSVSWQKKYEGVDASSSQILQTDNGDYTVMGQARDTNNKICPWIAKLTSNGNIKWQKLYGRETYGNYKRIFSLEPTSDGSYIAAGGFQIATKVGSYFRSNREAWILKIDSNGYPVWQKALGSPLVAEGYGGWDEGKFAQQISDGGYIMGGPYDDQVARKTEGWVVKFDSKGNTTLNPGAVMIDTTTPVYNASISPRNNNLTVINTNATSR